MTIVFLSPRFYPEIGGVEKHVFEIAKILSKKNKIIVITEGKKDQTEDFKAIKIIRLNFGKPGWFKKFTIWWKVFKYRKLIKKADVIHCHDVFFWYLPLRIFYPRKKVYITFHGYETVFPPKASSIIVRRLSEKLSNGSIAVGKYIEKWYGTNSGYVTYGAVNKVKSSKFRSERRKLRLRIKNSKKLKILFIGRIERDNGVKIYAEALSKLKNYKFEALGDGSLRYDFEKFGKVRGFVKDADKFIKRSDIIFSSSYLSISEGLNHMKPVFSVYENLLKKDYLNQTPFSKWIFISSSAKDLTDQINKIRKTHRTTEENLEKAFSWVKDETWENLAGQYLKLWQG